MTLLLFGCALAGRAEPDPQPAPPSLPPSEVPAPMPVPAELLEVEAILTAFRPGALRDHLDGGGFTVFDAATVRLSAPPEHAGRELTFYLEQPVATDSPWRTAGSLLCFSLRPADLQPGRKLFGGAARNLRPC